MTNLWTKIRAGFKSKPVKKLAQPAKQLTWEEQLILTQARLKRCEQLIEQLKKESKRTN